MLYRHSRAPQAGARVSAPLHGDGPCKHMGHLKIMGSFGLIQQ